MHAIALHLNHDSTLALDLDGEFHNIELERIFGKRHFDARHERPPVEALVALAHRYHRRFDIGLTGPNYQEAQVRAASEALTALGLCPRVMIDCSHDNSHKDYTQQPDGCADVVRQVRLDLPILGAMIESNLIAGNQPFPPEAGIALRYGQSITHGCVDLAATADMLEQLAGAVSSLPAA
jgi:hypothetical protein